MPSDSGVEIADVLKNGIELIKVSEKKIKKAVFRIDPDSGSISWESRKHGHIPIECIKELRFAHHASFDRDRLGIRSSKPQASTGFLLPEEHWTTIVYVFAGASSSVKYHTLNVVAQSAADYTLWHDTVKKLVDVRHGLMDGLGDEETREEVWQRMYWRSADGDGDEKIGLRDVEKLCVRLGMRPAEAGIVKLFNQADKDTDGTLDRDQFRAFVKLLKRRPDIETIFQAISGGADQIDFPTFQKFMQETQKSTLDDDKLKNVFDKYTAHTSALPTNTQNPNESQPEVERATLTMSRDQFTRFLLSRDNGPFTQRERSIWQDMSHPLSDYYLSSSHNTYLVGNQLIGVSTIEGYIRALLYSCRTVELDIYNGESDEDEPIVYHGKTLTSKIPVRDICRAIKKYAFNTSPYAIIISAEVHCGVRQQDMIVQIMQEEFGDALVQAPVEGRPKIETLPSPEHMMGKIMLKAKNIIIIAKQEAAEQAEAKLVAQQADSDSSSSSEDEGESEGAPSSPSKSAGAKVKGFFCKAKSKAPFTSSPPKPASASDPAVPASKSDSAAAHPKMSFALAALLVYTVGIKWRGFAHRPGKSPYRPEHIFSLSENKANGMLKDGKGMIHLMKHNTKCLTRVYPKGLRVNSTNFEPNRYWAAGCQVVALNWQTFDIGYMMNMAMFKRNGRSGYVLKPSVLRDPSLKGLKESTKHVFKVKVISAQQLPSPRNKDGEEIVDLSSLDPVVEVVLHIPDWSHMPHAPAPSTDTSTSSDSEKPVVHEATFGNSTIPTKARTISMKTHAVKNNGFNPVWDKDLELPFDVVGGRDMLDLVFVRFAVWEKGEGGDDDDTPLASYCISLGSLEQGFRHLPLHDQHVAQFLFSTLFVKIEVEDV